MERIRVVLFALSFEGQAGLAHVLASARRLLLVGRAWEEESLALILAQEPVDVVVASGVGVEEAVLPTMVAWVKERTPWVRVLVYGAGGQETVEARLGIDGMHESVVYAFALGGKRNV